MIKKFNIEIEIENEEDAGMFWSIDLKRSIDNDLLESNGAKLIEVNEH